MKGAPDNAMWCRRFFFARLHQSIYINDIVWSPITPRNVSYNKISFKFQTFPFTKNIRKMFIKNCDNFVWASICSGTETGKMKSLLWLVICWLRLSPGHQQPCYCPIQDGRVLAVNEETKCLFLGFPWKFSNCYEWIIVPCLKIWGLDYLKHDAYWSYRE